MRIFKNRGDIYVPSAKFKSDLEQRILLISLSFIVVFTIIFVSVFGIKYNFSAKEFFTPDNIKNQSQEIAEQLPEVSGKSNFLFVLSNKNTNEMYFCTIIQADMDTVSYKACTLSPSTNADGTDINSIYKSSGAGGVVNSLNNLFGIDIDYFIDESFEDYQDMFDAFGSVNYMVLEDVKYKDTSKYGFNIKIKAGEQKFNGDNAEKLMRYYIVKEQNYSAVNDMILASLSQQINEENFEKRENLFSKFIQYSTTDITVKNFTENIDAMKVLSSETTGVNVYNAAVQYDGDSIISSSINDIKGYFTK